MDKVNKLIKIADDLKYLAGEYSDKTLWGSREGGVTFSSLVEYLSKHDNALFIDHLIKVAKKMEEI